MTTKMVTPHFGYNYVIIPTHVFGVTYAKLRLLSLSNNRYSADPDIDKTLLGRLSIIV